MRAAAFISQGKIEVQDFSDPVIVENTDAVVKISATCVCGSDLWYFRGMAERDSGSRIGHEFIGEIVELGSEVKGLAVGDFVIAPFKYSCGVCANCKYGAPANCQNGGIWGLKGVEGGQGEYARVPFAETTLVKFEGKPDHAMQKHLLALSDVACTGYHAAISARVKQGGTVAVIGDGAVGLSAVMSAAILGAERIFALSTHEPRQQIAKKFGATDIIDARGEEAKAIIRDLTDGVGVDSVMECVGTEQSSRTAFDIVRAAGTIGTVGVPHGLEWPAGKMFSSNITVSGGVAHARKYIPTLLEKVISGEIEPGLVFDYEFDFENIQAAYEAMAERKATKAISFVA